MRTGPSPIRAARTVLGALAAITASSAATAREASTAAHETGAAAATGGDALLERDRLTGGWGGHRARLEDAGLTVGAEYVAEFSGVLDGGVRTRGSFRNLLTIDAELDLGAALGLEGATVFLQYLGVNPETGGSADAGDLQVYSNIEADKHLSVIFELWYEQRFLDDRLRVKAGKIDANSEFAFVDAAGDFANSSAGFSPTVFAFPSYPDPAMSVNVFGTVLRADGHALTLGYGLYDGAGADGVPTGRQGPASFFSDDRSDDYFHVAQAELRWDELGAEGSWLLDGRLSAGLWYHTGEFERFDAGTDDGAHGFFLTAEQRLVGEADTDRGLYAFAQLGLADEDVSEFGAHYGAGLVLRGITEGRPDDSAGVYVSLADLSDAPGAGFDEDELVVDAYYRLRLIPSVYIQPEIQYIVHPSGDRTIDDAVVGGLRIGVTF